MQMLQRGNQDTAGNKSSNYWRILPLVQKQNLIKRSEEQCVTKSIK
jgi:hypothetical protein